MTAWSEWFKTFGVYVVGQVIWPLFVLMCVTLYWKWWRPRGLRRTVWAWDTNRTDQAPAILVDAVQSIVAGTYVRPSVGLGAATALGVVASALNQPSLWHSKPMTMSIPVLVVGDSLGVTAMEQRNIVILGGPITNCLTKEIVELLAAKSGDGMECRYLSSESGQSLGPRAAVQRPFSFSVVDRTIELCGSSYTGDVQSPLNAESVSLPSYNGDDVGVFIRMPSLYSSSRQQQNRRTVCFFGSKTFGVHGAAQWLVSSGNKSREVERMLRSERDVVGVVQLKVRNGQVVGCDFGGLATIP